MPDLMHSFAVQMRRESYLLFVFASVFVSSPCLGQTTPDPNGPAVGNQTLRSFGTNLFDLTEVFQGKLPAGSTFVLDGEVISVLKGESLILRKFPVRFEHVGATQSSIVNSNPDEILALLVGSQIGRNGPISLNNYLSLGPSMRAQFRQMPPTELVMLRNPPDAALKIGTTISIPAVPTRDHGQIEYKGKKVSVPYLDYGKGVTNLFDYAGVFRVTTTGLVHLPLPSHEQREEIARRGEEQKVKLLDHQMKMAEKGNASSQYDIGVRFLNGDGVSQDKVLAIKWLKKAADQRHSQAQRKLKSLTEPTNP